MSKRLRMVFCTGQARCLLTLCLLALAIPALAAEPAATPSAPPALESLMSEEDFRAAGLDKLSEAERARFGQWLADYLAGQQPEQELANTASVAGATAGSSTTTNQNTATISDLGPAPPKTAEQRAAEKDVVIAARVIPRFGGWSGNTIFKLDNGQVWQQRQVGKLRYSGDDDNVTISQNLMGLWVLRHADSRRGVGVKRIQ